MTQAHVARAAPHLRTSRRTRPHGFWRIALIVAMVTGWIATSGRPSIEAAADGQVWALVDTEVNPSGDTERPGWSVSASPGSITVDIDIFPDSPDSTARLTGSVTWGAFPETLSPGGSFALPVSVEATPTTSDRGFFSGVAAIALVDNLWNRDSVSVDASCTDPQGDTSSGGMVCAAEDPMTGTLDYPIPGGGDEFRVGVGLLNCGGTCHVNAVYEFREAPAPDAPAPTTTAPGEPGETADPPSSSIAAPSRGTALSRVSADDLERFDAMKIAWSVLADGALGGRTTVQSLELLRDLTDDYFSDLILDAIAAGDEALADALRDKRSEQLGYLAGKLDEARERAVDDALGVRSSILQRVIAGGADVDPDGPVDVRVDRILDALRDRTADDRAALDGQLVPSPDGVTDDDGVIGQENVFRTVRFVNVGSDAVTVRAESYVPAIDVEYPLSEASTVVFPDPNPTAALALPRGTYTFCFDWGLGVDDDGDGLEDERHRSTGEITLGRETPEDVDRAPVMTLDPTGGSPGSCPGASAPDGDFTPSSPAGGFSPEEEAANGLATYRVVCTYPDGFVEEFDRRYRFVIGDPVSEWYDEDDGSAVDLFWSDGVRYETADGFYVVEFTAAGFDIVPVDPADGSCTATRET